MIQNPRDHSPCDRDTNPDYEAIARRRTQSGNWLRTSADYPGKALCPPTRIVPIRPSAAPLNLSNLKRCRFPRRMHVYPAKARTALVPYRIAFKPDSNPERIVRLIVSQYRLQAILGGQGGIGRKSRKGAVRIWSLSNRQTRCRTSER
jgi:hypothetical protein